MFIKVKYQGETVKVWKPFDYAAAAADLIEINKEIADGTFDPARWTKAKDGRLLETLYVQWLERKAKLMGMDKFSPETMKAYTGYLRNHFPRGEHKLCGLDVRKIRLKHLQLFYDHLPVELSTKTKKNMMDCLHGFFAWLKRWGEIDEVPVWPELEEYVEAEREALTYEEQQEALTRIPDAHRGVIDFLMETGIRPGEVCALMEIDIDWKGRRAIVRRTYKGSKIGRPKQKKDRTIVMSDRACELVEKNAGQSEFVFTNSATKRGYMPEFLRRVWRKHAGIDIELYAGTRHSTFSQWAESGVNELELNKLTGHADIRTTRKYFHPSDSRQREIVNHRGKVIELPRRTEAGQKTPAK